MTKQDEIDAFDDTAGRLRSEVSKVDRLRRTVQEARKNLEGNGPTQRNLSILESLRRVTLRRKSKKLQTINAIDPTNANAKGRAPTEIIKNEIRDVRYTAPESRPKELIYPPSLTRVACWLEYLFHFHSGLLKSYFKEEYNSDFPREFHEAGQLPPLSNTRSSPAEEVIGQVINRSSQEQRSEISSTLILEPITSSQKFHFSNTQIDVLGRQEEETILKRFLGGGYNFRWLQIAGAGGQGKSRLAHDLMLKSQKERGWFSGFLNEKNLKAFEPFWDTWNPSKSTLIIIDYVLGNEAAIKTAIQSLVKPGRQFPHPVRMLLVERQRWDRGALEKSKKSETSHADIRKSEFSPSLGGKTEWFVKLCNRSDGEDKELHDCCFKDKYTNTMGVIELEQLSPDDLFEIVEQYAGRGLVGKFDEGALKKHLDRIDRSGRPLFAYFLANAIKEGKYQSHWTQDDLLKDTIEANQRKYWKAEFGDNPPKVGDNTFPARIAVLATMINGLDSTQLPIVDRWAIENDLMVRQAIVLNDGHLGASGEAQSLVPPLLPDILGEWFVLRSFGIFMGRELVPIVQLAWKLAPKKMGVFLQRLAQDFPTNDSLQEMLDVHLPDNLSTSEYQSVSSSIFGILHKAKITYPPQLLTQLSIAAEDGQNVDAILTLGYCKLVGDGFEKDEEDGYLLTLKAAQKKSVTAMVNLGSCYQNGTGVKADPEKAVRWYENSAALDNSVAMFNLGVCYLIGTGVKADPEEAVRWYENSAALDNSDAMFNLGNCYLNGTGVKAAPEKAVRWYENSAALDNSVAMFNLGVCYLIGTGVKADPEEAVRWYENSAALDNSAAMFNLGNCYRNGTGVEANKHRAFEWLLKAIATIPDQAREENEFLLACEFGIIETVVRSIGTGVNVNCQRSGNRRTGLIIACNAGELSVVKLLIQQPNIDPNIQEWSGFTALVFAAGHEYLEILCALISHPEINLDYQLENSATALYFAAAMNKVDSVHLLLEAGVNPMLKDKDGLTAAERALQEAENQDLHQLLKQAEVDWVDKHGPS